MREVDDLVRVRWDICEEGKGRREGLRGGWWVSRSGKWELRDAGYLIPGPESLTENIKHRHRPRLDPKGTHKVIDIPVKRECDYFGGHDSGLGEHGKTSVLSRVWRSLLVWR